MRRSSFIIVFLVILAIPIILNFVIQLPAIFPVVGEPVNWLMFWATYLGAATSFLMIVYTALTLKQNKEQLDELKRQWNEVHQPAIFAYMMSHESYFYICIKNTSIVPLRDVKISITHVPQNGVIPSEEFFLNPINDVVFSIEPNGCRYINTYAMLTSSPIANDFIGLKIIYNGNNEYCVDLYFKEASIICDNLVEKKLHNGIHDISFRLAQIQGKLKK
jgi:hypothetical protein